MTTDKIKSALKNKSSPIIELDKRSKEIFSLIVDDFVTTGEPVGSRKLSSRLDEKLSPASVRNVMSDLQDAGLLTSSHSSAGRYPTDLGMKFFVDGLLQVGKLSKDECSKIKKNFLGGPTNFEQMYDNAIHMLSGLSDCAGLVVAPKLEGGMKHIEFVPVGKEQALVIMVSENGLIAYLKEKYYGLNLKSEKHLEALKVLMKNLLGWQIKMTYLFLEAAVFLNYG